MRPPRPARGFTLIEMALVIAAAMALLAVSLGGWAALRGGGNAAATQNIVMQVMGAVHATYPSANYGTLTTALVAQAGTLPDRAVSGSQILSDWGQPINVRPADALGGTNNAFEVEVTGTPKEACTRLIAGVEQSFEAIYTTEGAGMGGGAGKGMAGAAPMAGVPNQPIKDLYRLPPISYNPARAINQCAGGAGAGVTVVFKAS